MNIEAVRTLVPGRVRLWLYALWVLAAVTVGTIDAWTSGSLDWLPAANRALEYLMVPLGILAAVNVTPDHDSDLAGYVPRYAAKK